MNRPHDLDDRLRQALEPPADSVRRTVRAALAERHAPRRGPRRSKALVWIPAAAFLGLVVLAALFPQRPAGPPDLGREAGPLAGPIPSVRILGSGPAILVQAANVETEPVRDPDRSGSILLLRRRTP